MSVFYVKIVEIPSRRTPKAVERGIQEVPLVPSPEFLGDPKF